MKGSVVALIWIMFSMGSKEMDPSSVQNGFKEPE
jgi:hypothetical protein